MKLKNIFYELIVGPLYGEVLQYQQQTMQDQDAALDTLGESIARTKNIAYAISKETDEHLALIDDISLKTDKTNVRVRNNIKKVERIERKLMEKEIFNY